MTQENNDLRDRVPTVGVVVFRQNPKNPQVRETLLVRNGDDSGHPTGTYVTAGGRVDPGETDIVAAVRELNEETGLKTTPEHLLRIPKQYEADIPRKSGVLRVTHKVFVCTQYEGELQPEEGISFPEWVDMREISALSLGLNIEDMINQSENFLKTLEHV